MQIAMASGKYFPYETEYHPLSFPKHVLQQSCKKLDHSRSSFYRWPLIRLWILSTHLTHSYWRGWRSLHYEHQLTCSDKGLLMPLFCLAFPFVSFVSSGCSSLASSLIFFRALPLFSSSRVLVGRVLFMPFWFAASDVGTAATASALACLL